jgi:hypothetical protein
LDKHTAYFNILDALPQRGCVFCRLGHYVEVSFITDVLYSKTTSVQMRGELRKARGFCLDHARQLDDIGHALDLSIIYQDILMTLQEEIEKPTAQQAVGRRGKRRVAGAMGAQAECPACAWRTQLEEVYIETFLDHLVDPAFVAQVRTADPICLQHYRQAIEQRITAAQFQTLREMQVAHWKTLIAELGEFVRKHDHRFRHEPVGQEGDAWIRAIDAIVGTRKF